MGLCSNETNEATKCEAGMSIGFFTLGGIIGVIVSVALLIKFSEFYRKLSRCVRPTTGPEDVLVVDNGLKDGRRCVHDQYSEIDENSTQTFARPHGGGLETVTFVRRDGYEHCSIEAPRQKYSSILMTTGDQSRQNYEPVYVRRSSDETSQYEDRSTGPIYHILEPGSNKRLPVRPLGNEMLHEDHVYFKLESGSDKVVQIPRNYVNASYRTPNSEEDDTIFVLVVDRQSECFAEPYAVNDINDQEPAYYTLEKEYQYVNG